MRFAGLAWLLCAAVALAGLGGCSNAVLPERILLIGADGLEWSVALPLVREGAMPELAALMRRGTFGYLKSEKPTISPLIWTSIATAKHHRKHGVRSFKVYDRLKSPKGRLTRSGDRRTKAFWNILTEYDRRVHLIGWWLTYPVEEINGVMVAQTNTASYKEVWKGDAIHKGGLLENVPRQVHPVEREKEMLDVLRSSESRFSERVDSIFGPGIGDASAIAGMLWTASEWAFRADGTYAEIGRRLAAASEPFDVLAIYIGGTDVVGHRFWRYHEPHRYEHRPPADEVEKLGDVIPAYYRYLDGVIGELVRACPAGTTVFVASDHGMVAHNQSREFEAGSSLQLLISGNHVRAEPGVFVASGPGIRQTGTRGTADLELDDLPTVGSIYDVVPTLLALLGVPVGDDMDGNVLEAMIADGVLDARPVQRVASHDTTEWLVNRQKLQVQIDESEREKQLRELGYIE